MITPETLLQNGYATGVGLIGNGDGIRRYYHKTLPNEVKMNIQFGSSDIIFISLTTRPFCKSEKLTIYLYFEIHNTEEITLYRIENKLKTIYNHSMFPM